MRKIIGIFGVMLATLAPVSLWADGVDDAPNYWHGHMFGMGDGYDGGLMLLGPILMLALLALVVAGIVQFLRSGGTKSQSSSSLETLDMRLARGEIDAAEYRERKDILLG